MTLRDTFPYIENPSFSLGLSQEETQNNTDGTTVQELETVEEESQILIPQRRKSLRLRTSSKSTSGPSTSLEQVQDVKSVEIIDFGK